MEHKETSPVLINALKRLLASEYTLYTKVWGFHWNLIGTDFAERHSLYGDWKDTLSDDIDTLAERLRQLGAVSPGSTKEFLTLTAIKETDGVLIDEASSASILYEDVCVLCAGFYKAIEVAEAECKVTSNILQELAAHIDKIKWFLASITATKSSVTVAVIKASGK